METAYASNGSHASGNGSLVLEGGNCLNLTCSNTTEIVSTIESTPEAYVVPVVFAIIFIVGVVGNSTLIFIVCHNKNMRNVPNIFIVSLALGDLLLILVSVPFTATIYTFTEWPYGETMCKVNEFLQSLSLGVSVFTLTALSGDRFIAIVNPLQRHKTSSMSMTLSIAGGIWALAAMLASLELVAAHVKRYNYDGKVLELCVMFPESWGEWYPKFHSMYKFFIFFAIPMTIIGSFYMLMARILLVSSRRMPGEDTQASQFRKQMEARKKVAKVILSFVIVFVVCWLPRHAYLLWYHFDPADYNLFWHIFKILGFCMCFINSCVNPLALYFLSKQFRLYYNRYLFPCCRKQKRTREQEYSSMYNFNSVRRTSGNTTMTVLQSQTCC